MDLLKDLFSSKKFMASMAATIAVLVMKLAGKAGFGLDPVMADEVSKLLCVIVSSYVVAQGIADHGKEAAKINTAYVANLAGLVNKPGPSTLLEDGNQ